MKLITSALAALAIALVPLAASAGEVGTGDFGQRFVNQNCGWCHGGPSLQGYTTAPRLAGQRSEYLVKELMSFKHHVRDNPLSQQIMWGAVERVDEDVARVVAIYIASLDARAANDGVASLASRGAELYRDGDAEAGIPACLVCHGPNGEGVGAIPRLGGLSARYINRRLQEWGEGYHASAAFPMSAFSGRLSDVQIDALSSYLSFIK
jgi:cytochrome c553